MSRADEIAEGVARGFRSAWLEDRQAGRRRSVSEYLEDYPREFWDLIACEFADAEQAAAAPRPAERGAGDAAPASGGTLLPSHYRVISELGRGGQATVYLAEDLRLHREVALKVLAPGRLASRDALERFHREAEVASRLQHPGICTIFEAGSEGESAFIAMQYVEGESLGHRIRERSGPQDSTLLSEPSSDAEPDSGSEGRARHGQSSSRVERDEIMGAVKLIEDVARALHAAHEAGVVHRDVKPTNIMVDSEGRPMLTDFGLARQEDSDLPTLTRTGELFGTPAYMSPEQLTRQAIHLDRRSDVWSLGVTLYECLTLRRPFVAATREQLYLAIMGSEPPNPRRLNPAIPRDLTVVLETALEKNRERRYQTALDFAEDLRRVRAGEPTRARPVPMLGRAWRWVRRKPMKAAAAAAVIVALATAGYLVARWSDLERGREAARRARLEAIVGEAYTELGHGRPGQAREEFGAALDLDPSSLEARAGAALACLRLGDAGAASAVLDAGEADPRLIWIRAEILRNQGLPKEARDLERSAAGPRDAMGWYLRGALALNLGHGGQEVFFGKALDLLHRAIFCASAPRALYFYGLGDAAHHVGDAETCRRVAEALIHNWPEDATAWDQAGYTMRSVDPETALRYLDEAVALDAHEATIWFHRGDVLAAMGRRDAAGGSFLEAIGIDSSYVTAWNRLGMNRVEQGRFAEAADAFDHAIALEPNDARLWHNRGIAAHRLGHLEDAASFFEKAAGCDPKAGGCWSMLVVALRERGLLDEAIAAGRRGVERARDKAGVYDNLGIALHLGGEIAAALEAFEEALEIQPLRSGTWNNYALSLEKAGRLEEAIAALEQAVKLDPNNLSAVDTLRVFGEQLWNGGDPAIVERCYRAVGGTAHAQAGDHCNHGTILFALKRFEKAVRAHDRALALEPRHAQALCNQGHALRMLGRLETALESMRRGHEAAQAEGGWSCDSAGWVAQLENAVETQKRLDEWLAGSGTPPGRDELGDFTQVCFVQRRWADAAVIWREAFARWPDLAADLSVGHRLKAARFAARAGTGQDRSALDATTRATWRNQALAWLTADLELLRGATERSERRARHFVALLRSWQTADAFAPLREPAALGTLPATERRGWTALWRAVNDLVDAVE